jgi:23S rRNA pseudouridine1911/1915/1917 synthase
VNALLHHIGFRGAGEVEGLSTVTSGPRFEGDPTVRPGLVHRLDKDTSGVMLVAKTDAVHLRLARQFSKRSIDRLYWAILLGCPQPQAGTVDTFIGRDPRDRKRMTVRPEPEGKHAVTNYRVVEILGEGASLTEFRLQTGRTHQIRVHAQHIGHPVLGDPMYGGRTPVAVSGHPERRRAIERVLHLLNRQALHAKTLGFDHPVTGERLFFDSPLPDDMAGALAALRGAESPGPDPPSPWKTR